MKNPPRLESGREAHERLLRHGSRVVLCALVLDVFVTNAEAMKMFIHCGRKTAFVEGRNGQFGVALNCTSTPQSDLRLRTDVWRGFAI
jgi:hypothetical protein